MHATIPTLPKGVHYLMQSGLQNARLQGEIREQLERLGGRALAEIIAHAIKLGFGFLVLEGLDEDKARKAESFFKDNFVMRDPNTPSGIRYYQGKFLLRTRKPGDEMNVYLRFCPDPDDLYISTPFGNHLDPSAIVQAEAVSEAEADAIEHDPKRMDLVIRFRDIPAILGLVQRPDADVVQLLLENLVQITGNFGHMFKFGAIGKSVQNTVMGDG